MMLTDGAFAKFVQGPEFDPYTGRKDWEWKEKRKDTCCVVEKVCESNAMYEFYNGQEMLAIEGKK